MAYSYDKAGRRVGETHTPPEGAATRTIAYAWDADGQLTGYTDHNTGQPCPSRHRKRAA